MFKKIILIIFISLGLFFSFYHLPQQYIFEYDRERDYYDVKAIVIDHKIPLIGPTVNAFIYLGPWYNYFQVPPFVIFRGDPLYGAYLIATINFAVCLLIYFLVKRLTSSQLVTFFSAVLWVSSATRTNWSVSFLPLFFLIIVCLYEQLRLKKTLLSVSLLTFFWSLSLNFHPQMIFLAPVWLYVTISFFSVHKGQRLKSFLSILFAFLAPLFTLILFDLRHNFLDTRAMIRFLASSPGNNISSAIPRFRLLYSLEQFALPIAFPYEQLKHNIPFSLFFFFLGLLFVIRNRRYFYLLLIPICSVVLMSFYRAKTWPEYYHYLGGLSLMLLLFIAAAKTKLAKIIFLAISLLIIWSNFNYLMTYAEPTSYFFKRQVIQYMIEQNKPYERMNIENDFPFGEGLGFRPIREFYEKPTGQYPPTLRFYVSYAGSPRQNTTEKIFGAYGVSIINLQP